MVHLLDEGDTHRGVLDDVVPATDGRMGGVVLSAVELLPDQGPDIPLGGRAFISHDRIAWIQEPSG